MQFKIVEIRDRATFIPAMIMRVTATSDIRQNWLLWRAGFVLNSRTLPPNFILIHLGKLEAQVDPCRWDNRTMKAVHQWFIDDPNRFAQIKLGDVVDAEFVMGITSAPRHSEMIDPHGTHNPPGVND